MLIPRSSPSDDQGLPTGQIAAFVIAGIVVLIAAILGIVLYTNFRRYEKNSPKASTPSPDAVVHDTKQRISLTSVQYFNQESAPASSWDSHVHLPASSNPFIIAQELESSAASSLAHSCHSNTSTLSLGQPHSSAGVSRTDPEEWDAAPTPADSLSDGTLTPRWQHTAGSRALIPPAAQAAADTGRLSHLSLPAILALPDQPSSPVRESEADQGQKVLHGLPLPDSAPDPDPDPPGAISPPAESQHQPGWTTARMVSVPAPAVVRATRADDSWMRPLPGSPVRPATAPATRPRIRVDVRPLPVPRPATAGSVTGSVTGSITSNTTSRRGSNSKHGAGTGDARSPFDSPAPRRVRNADDGGVRLELGSSVSLTPLAVSSPNRLSHAVNGGVRLDYRDPERAQSPSGMTIVLPPVYGQYF